MKSLRWSGPILDMSGYASAARGYLRAAEAFGLAIRAQDRSRSINLAGKGIDQPILDLYERLSKTKVPDDCPAVQHQTPDCFVNDRKAKMKIGYTIFEMIRVPQVWVPFCNSMDVIWTGSEYSKDAFINSGVRIPVEVLPHAIDVEAYAAAKPWQISNKRKFAFLSVFDFTARKAWQDLLRAYWTAFSEGDDVCLILKVFYDSFSETARADIIRRILKYRESLKMERRAPILIYGHDVPNSDMAGLYKAANCYVGISREGFGLSYAEAMAAGLLCIGPEVGGTRCYMSPENSMLVKYIGEEPISPEMIKMNPTFEGLSWAKHSWEHLAELMRKAVYDEETRKTLAKNGTDFIGNHLTFRAIGARLNALLPGEASGELR